jgi:hypothetical protein
MATQAPVDPRIVNRCRRGDIIAWARLQTVTYLDGRPPAAPECVWHIGIVTGVTRDGVVKTADDGLGRTAVDHSMASAAVRGEQIDIDKARAWLASDANYPRTGSTPLHTLDEVRAVVRTWLKG